jgi:TolA-binding protein
MTNTSQIPADVAANVSIASTIVPAARKRALLSMALLLVATTGIATAVTPPPVKPAPAVVSRAVIVQPSANAQFQQKVRQAQVRNELQQAQVEQQNHQTLRDSIRRPYANNPQMQQQMDQSDAAQQRTDRARQQSIIDRYDATPPPPGRVVVPVKATPAKPANGG